MKIANIRYGKKKNLGNYESEEIVLEVVIEDGEAPGKVLDAVRDMVDYKLYYEEREARFKAYSKELAELPDDEKSAARRNQLNRWFEKYGEWKQRAEAALKGEVL